MRLNKSRYPLLVWLSLTACASARVNGETNAALREYAGWYMEHSAERLFQPCGHAQPWRVTSTADLERRAKAFGLDEDTPVYVRVTGVAAGQTIAVSRVDQFGASKPVRDCALTGVVTPPER